MERPVIFNSENVRAILGGRKTQTRRVVKFQLPDSHRVYKYVYPHPNGGFSFQDFPSLSGISNVIDKTGKMCPYGQVGDKLWVRETWCQDLDLNGITTHIVWKASAHPNAGFAWRPSIFMPKWVSRITLEITEIRVQRLQEITEEDATKEGFTTQPGFTSGGNIGLGTAGYWYMKLWDFLNAKRGYGWETNPWVWVISFKLAL